MASADATSSEECSQGLVQDARAGVMGMAGGTLKAGTFLFL